MSYKRNRNLISLDVFAAVCLTVAVLVGSVQAAPLNELNSPHNVNRNVHAKTPSEYFGEWPGHKYHPSPKDWRDINIYHLMTDRFVDGNPLNNDGKYSGYNPRSIQNRHGGDFAGILSKLDYLQALGVKAIWVSPIFQNQENSYHGYAQIDYTLLDDRLGTVEDLRRLVDEAHKRGMYVIVDIIVNHLADLYYFENHQYEQAPFQLHENEYKLFPRNPEKTYVDFKVDNTFDPEAKYCNVYDKDAVRYIDTGKGSYSNSDLHHNGTLTNYFNAWNIHYGKIYNALDDVRTSHPRVQDKIIAMTKSLISSVDVDGFRIDTPMQVPHCFFQKWIPAVREHAESLGKKNFAFFGEFYSSTPWAGTLIGRGKFKRRQNAALEPIGETFLMDGGIDYLFYKKFLMANLHKEMSGKTAKVKDVYEMQNNAHDFVHRESKEERYRMLHFFNSHDQRRLCAEKNGLLKTKLAMASISLLPGIPTHYYGDEQDLCSFASGISGYSRESMMRSVAWDTHPSPHGENPAGKDNFDMTHPYYLFLQRLNQIRAVFPVLRRTNKIESVQILENNGPGVVVFTREKEGEKAVLVMLNYSSEAQSVGGEGSLINISHFSELKFKNVLGEHDEILFNKSGDLEPFSLDPLAVKVFVSSENFLPVSQRVLEVIPEHDKFLRNFPETIFLRFEHPVAKEDFQDGIFLNDRALTADEMRLGADLQTLELSPKGGGGLWKIRIPSSSKLKNFIGFESRFVVGKKKSPFQRGVVYDDYLINDGENLISARAVKLHHKALGAKYFRVSGNKGWNFSEWLPYEEVTTFDFHYQSNDWNELLVQYYMDGSSSYYVRDGVDIWFGDGWPVG
jgi:glycosidase